MPRLTEKTINYIEKAPTNFSLWAITFLSLIAVRILIENWLTDLKNQTGFFLFYEFSHTFLFFLIAYLLFIAILRKTLDIEWKKISTILLFGYLLIIFPPIIDFIVSGGKGYWSFYEFDGLKGLVIRFFTFFGSTPEIGITYGVRIEIALAVIFMGVYSYIKSRRFLRAVLLAIVSYAVLFILGTFPSWITIAVQGFSKGFLNINEINVAQLFLSPASLFYREVPDIISALNIKMSLVYALFLSLIALGGLLLFEKEKFMAFVRNARVPQLIYHAGLVMIGIWLGFISIEPKISSLENSFNLFNFLAFIIIIEAVWCAWLASIVFNDLIDKNVDERSNANRPLVRKIFSDKEYASIGIVLFFFSIFLAAIVNFKIALLLIAYQTLAWIYSAWPLRLKRFPLLATFISAIASLIILFSGYILVSPDQSIHGIPFSLLLLLTIGYTLSLPVKDFKDIDGDKENGISSIPVLFGEQWGKIIVGCGIFLSFILSVVLLNEPRLFWWALLTGTAAFWLVINMKKKASESHINYRNIYWWILGIITVYALIIAIIAF